MGSESVVAQMGHIHTMQEFIACHRRDYVEPSRCSKKERDRIESEVGMFVKTCQQQIELLKGTATQGGNESAVAHQHGVVRAPHCALLIAGPFSAHRLQGT